MTVVAPLYSTTALWTIFFAALVLGRSEVMIGRRLVFAAVLVVAGGALIGASR